MKEQQQKLSRMDRKKTEMRNKIITTTIQLIRTYGFEKTTMEQIAMEADIAKGTLYNYYPEKEAILCDYIDHAFEEKNAFRLAHLKTLTDTRSRMVYIINNLMDGIEMQSEVFEKYLVYRMKQILSLHSKEDANSGIAALIFAIIEAGQQQGDLRRDLPLTMIVDFFQFLFIEVAKQYYTDPNGFNQKKTVESSVDLFINGVKLVNM